MAEDQLHQLADGNFDPAAIKDIETATAVYKALRLQILRDEVHERNLERRVQKLRADLDVRVEDVEKYSRAVQFEQARGSDQQHSVQREREVRAAEQEERIFNVLSQVLYAKPDGASEPKVLDTVMISFIRPEGHFRYNLAFHVDTDTTVADLLGIACRYWGVDAEDHVLKTMASNKCQDDLLAKECFRPGEIAQLRLEQRNRRPSEPTDDELKAIRPRVASRKKRQKERGYDGALTAIVNGPKQPHNYGKELRKMGGAYFLLRKRPVKPSEHCAKIKLRDVLIYTALAFMTGYTYAVTHPNGNSYWFRRGFEARLDIPTPSAPSFSDVQTHGQMWEWLENTLPSLVFPTGARGTDSLRARNQLLGYVAIRMQGVRAPSSPTANCRHNAQVVQQLEHRNASCPFVAVGEGQDEQGTLEDVRTYWRQRIRQDRANNASGRLGPHYPWRWASAGHNWQYHNIAKISGRMQSYDASGYTVEFAMNETNASEEYKIDMEQLRSLGWVSNFSRLVVVSFTAYNINYDLWLANDLIFELVPSGLIIPSSRIVPFRPAIFETRNELTLGYMGFARIVVALYILISVGIVERQHKIKNHKAGCWYHLSFNGICDLAIVVCVLTATCWRRAALGVGTHSSEWYEKALDLTGRNGFYSFSNMAHEYWSTYCLDGLLMVFIMCRMFSFTRLNRTVYFFWHTYGTAMKGIAFLIAAMALMILGIAFFLCTIYGPLDDHFSTYVGTMLQIYRLQYGQMDNTLLSNYTTYIAIILAANFIVISFFTFSLFVVVLTDAYYVVHLTTAPGDAWDAGKRARWFVPGLILDIYQALFAPPPSLE